MGKLTNLNPIADSEIPATIARDSEVTAALNAHLGATDPHPQYLLPSEGDARYRLISTALTDSDIPSTIARDSELTATMNAHLGATDPHPQYLLPSEGDARYRLSSTAFFAAVPFPTANIAGNSIAFSWNSVQNGQGTAEFCNYSGTGGGDAYAFYRLPGNPIAAPTISNRVSRIDIGGAYIATSDERVKSDFSQFSGLEIVLALSPLKYKHWACVGFEEKNKTLKLGESFNEKIGFIAQDVQKVLPEAVAPPQSAAELYGIDYNCIVAVAVKAIQELRDQIAELRAQVQALKA
jgi:hypothetical protein